MSDIRRLPVLSLTDVVVLPGMVVPIELDEPAQAAVDAWRDIAALSDPQAAALIAADRIDILVDVNGYTKHARTKVVAHRPAPIIVNFCGYPGTMGSPYHHYMIADAQIVPPGHEIFYSEQVLRIPCNQPIDRKRPIAAERPSRAEAGLPDDAFVFASFNGMQKVTPNCFQRWMTILIDPPTSHAAVAPPSHPADRAAPDHCVAFGLCP